MQRNFSLFGTSNAIQGFLFSTVFISWPEGHEWNFRSPQQFAVHPSNCQWKCPLNESFRPHEIEWHLNRSPRIWYCDRNIQELRAELHIIKILKSILFVIIIGCLKRQAWPKTTWELEHLGQHLSGAEMAAPKLTVSLVSGEEQRTNIDDCWPPLVWLWVATRRFLQWNCELVCAPFAIPWVAVGFQFRKEPWMMKIKA